MHKLRLMFMIVLCVSLPTVLLAMPAVAAPGNGTAQANPALFARRCDIDHPQDCIINTPPPTTPFVPTIAPVPAATAVTAPPATACQPPAPNSPFAYAGFQTQWQQGEALTANFWGPTYTKGFSEPYVEGTTASGSGQRLVQYFDKGRMELTNPANSKVTNGLLANELITGQLQLGNNSFERRAAANIPIAGDPDNAGPTYASLGGNGASLLMPAPSALGKPVRATVAADGTVTTATTGTSDSAAATITYDSATQHNVPQAFAQFRDTVGLATVGYAKSEPFLTIVGVGGVSRQVMVQVFERRVLTYTADNPAQFRVEMGNIGIHYYRWRYCGG